MTVGSVLVIVAILAGVATLRALLSGWWCAEDPNPTYSELDREDGLGQVPEPAAHEDHHEGDQP